MISSVEQQDHKEQIMSLYVPIVTYLPVKDRKHSISAKTFIETNLRIGNISVVNYFLLTNSATKTDQTSTCAKTNRTTTGASFD